MKTFRAVGVALVVALFFIANRGAFKGYFSADDLDSLAWAIHARPQDWIKALADPRFSSYNFRPAGHIFYYALGTTFGLNFTPYVWLMQLLHLTNAGLVWALLRRLGAEERGAAAGVFLFVSHMACFDAFWKPMFIFDVMACFYTLLTLLLYTSRFWWAGVLTFWLAYKSKEIAVALPLFLLAYEYWVGNRKWLRAAPYAAVAASFSIQALMNNGSIQSDYTLRFTPEALWKTLSFYSSEILFVPYAGLSLVLVFALVKDRRVRLGLAGIVLLLGPLWFLPGRLVSVYLYVPMIGAAIALAFGVARWPVGAIVALCAAWIPVNYLVLKEKRREALSTPIEHRAYVEAIGRFHQEHPDIRTIAYESRPEHLAFWGIEGAFSWFYRRTDLTLIDAWRSLPKELYTAENLAVVGWDPKRRQTMVRIRDRSKLEDSYIEISRAAPLWQLGDGWKLGDNAFGWTRPVAQAKLRRPAGTHAFEARIFVGPGQADQQGGVTLEAVVDGRTLGLRRLSTEGWHRVRWEISSGEEKTVAVELRFPPYHPADDTGDVLGGCVGELGFVE